MYQFNPGINNANFFRFDRMLILTKRWANLSSASKSIYPVIGVHCDKSGLAFPSEETIAILSGRTPKTVIEGIAGLKESRVGFKVERYVTGRGHRANKYYLSLPPKEKGRTFFFYKAVIEGGNWLHLSPTAQALYPVMKSFVFWDFFEEETEEEDSIEVYANRDYDLSNPDQDVMCEYAGISHRSLYDALESLEEHDLIEKTDPYDGQDTWKVFRLPSKIYKRDYLNEMVSHFQRESGVMQKLPTK